MGKSWPHTGSYPGGSPVGPPNLPRPLYPPDAEKQGKKPSKDGPDILAWKRAMKRGQVWAKDKDLAELDDSYSNAFAHGQNGTAYGPGIEGFQLNQGIDPSGWVGETTYQNARYAKVPFGPNEGQPLFDSEACRLLQQAWDIYGGNPDPPQPEDEKAKVRRFLTEFCEKAIAEPWVYSQNRAIDVNVDPDDNSVRSDCSGSVIQAYHYAKRKSGVQVPDPAKYNYAGWGNTWDDEDGHPKVTNGQYLVGDLAHYDGHVCLCYHPGNADSSDWFSFGSEPPSKRKLYYRSDFKFVVRPPMSPQPGTYSTTFERFTFDFRIWKLQRILLFWRNGKRRGDPPTDPPS